VTATGPTFIVARSNPPAAFFAMSLLVLVVRQQETWRNGLTPCCVAEPKSMCRRLKIRDPRVSFVAEPCSSVPIHWVRRHFGSYIYCRQNTRAVDIEVVDRSCVCC
jgi:hypothetical protein